MMQEKEEVSEMSVEQYHRLLSNVAENMRIPFEPENSCSHRVHFGTTGKGMSFAQEIEHQ